MAAYAMEALAGRYRDRAVRSVFIYTREAHPGEHYGHHRTIEDKRRNARAFLDHGGNRRQILLDDLDGTAHRAYGLLPNMTWIIGRGGFIHYKSAWTSPDDVADALDRLLDFQQNRTERGWIPFYSERSAWSARDASKFREGLVRAGPQAVRDYDRMLEAHKDSRKAPSEDVGPRVPGNYYRSEDESWNRRRPDLLWRRSRALRRTGSPGRRSTLKPGSSAGPMTSWSRTVETRSRVSPPLAAERPGHGVAGGAISQSVTPRRVDRSPPE
jgi:hypothetical protein